MATVNEYTKAALALGNYINNHKMIFETPEPDVADARREFQELFSPEKLKPGYPLNATARYAS